MSCNDAGCLKNTAIMKMSVYTWRWGWLERNEADHCSRLGGSGAPLETQWRQDKRTILLYLDIIHFDEYQTFAFVKPPPKNRKIFISREDGSVEHDEDSGSNPQVLHLEGNQHEWINLQLLAWSACVDVFKVSPTSDADKSLRTTSGDVYRSDFGDARRRRDGDENTIKNGCESVERHYIVKRSDEAQVL